MRHDQLSHRDGFDILEIATNNGPAAAAIAEWEMGTHFAPRRSAPPLVSIPSLLGVGMLVIGVAGMFIP